MRRYKGQRPWNYLTLLLVLVVLALAVVPTVSGAKKEADYYEVGRVVYVDRSELI